MAVNVLCCVLVGYTNSLDRCGGSVLYAKEINA